jgi:hypothetical protein
VNSGNRSAFSSVFVCVAMLATSQAGRVGEDGSGALWIAPELIKHPLPVLECTQATEPQALELQFEMIEMGEDPQLPRLAAAGARRTVAFEWNAATGELSFDTDTAASAAMFRDLENPATRKSSLTARSCGSR